MTNLTIDLATVIAKVRREERDRAAKIVEDWVVHTPYIVSKMRLEDRREAIAKAIRGEEAAHEDHYPGA